MCVGTLLPPECLHLITWVCCSCSGWPGASRSSVRCWGRCPGEAVGALPRLLPCPAPCCRQRCPLRPGCCWQGHCLPFSAWGAVSCLKFVAYKYLLARAFKGQPQSERVFWDGLMRRPLCWRALSPGHSDQPSWRWSGALVPCQPCQRGCSHAVACLGTGMQLSAFS